MVAGRTRSTFVGTVSTAGDRMCAVWKDTELNGAVDVWETLSETSRSSNGGKERKERPEYGRTQ